MNVRGGPSRRLHKNTARMPRSGSPSPREERGPGGKDSPQSHEGNLMPNAADTPASGQSADASPAPEPNPTAETDALAIANQLRPVLLRLHRFLRGEAHELGVTSTQASLLAAMHRAPGVGLSELARREHMSAPTLVGHVDRLEAAGLVARARGNPTDLRRVGLTLTPTGLEMLQTLRAHRTAWLAAHLEALTPDELAAVAAAIGPLRRLTEGES